MHFEVLIEDISGKKMLELILPEVIGKHTFNVLPYKGIGRIPRNLNRKADPSKRIFLDNLPRLLRGYGKTFQAYGSDYPAVIVVCDLDDKDLSEFKGELKAILDQCYPQPETRFCISIEEGEAWFLGDVDAVKAAYPDAKESVLRAYVNDSICGTWEKLAEAVYPGGIKELSKKNGLKLVQKNQFGQKTSLPVWMLRTIGHPVSITSKRN